MLNLSEAPQDRLNPESQGPLRVVVVDFDIRFWTLANLMVKFGLALLVTALLTGFLAYAVLRLFAESLIRW